MAKYLHPTTGGLLTETQKKVLHRVSEKLSCCEDLKQWCESLGLRLICTDLEPPQAAVLHGDTIFMSNGLTMEERVFVIGHEIYHKEFHAAVTLYTLNKIVIRQKERQANLFAEALRLSYVG